MIRLVYLLLIGLFAQYVDGSLGMGYGVSSSSLLLAAGFMPAVVSASVHAAEVFSSLASSISHTKAGNVDKGIVIPLSITGVIGGVVGAYFLSNIRGELIKPFIGVLLLLLGVKIFVRFLWKKSSPLLDSRFSKKFLLPLGFVGGAVDAIGGGGWGPICTPALLSTNRTAPRYVVGSVNTAEFFTTVAITITFAFSLGFDKFIWGITLPLIIGGLIAAPIAAYTCKRIPSGALGTAIGAILILLNIRSITPAVTKLFGVDVPVNIMRFMTPGIIGFMLITLLVCVLMKKRFAAKEETES